TGHLPFEASDALGWVHAHLAAKPTPIREHNADIPLVLGAIVDKLMAKNPEDRYQSAHGLHHDLQACESQWQASGGIVPFELGQQDESAQFKVPEKLYGREREIECLMAGLDRVCQGSTELALISGFSGIGKSSIIDELIEPVTRRRAFFVSGKFDQFHRDIPYAPLLEAFRGLLRQVLAGSDEQIHAWRQRLMEAVGSNGQVLIDLLPEAELILGAQPSVPDLDAEQNRNRFQWVLENVVRAMAQPEHPLVIFLDDLQWADSATLSLLKSWLATGGIGFLYLLGAYRDNEVGDGHPLQRMLDEIEQADVAPIGLQIEPLAVDDVAHLLADMFKRTPDKVRPLAGLLRQRTSGNPFFLKAFLTHLHTDGTIVFNHRERGWTWDAARIQQHEMAENIVDFMVDKIQRLSQAAQQTLEIAACMGDRFTLPVLAGLSPCSARTIYDHLYDSIAQGLIVPLSALIRPEGDEIPELDYAFAHDRIRQAAYALVPETEKPVIHRQIGDILTRQLSEAQQEERLFDIVNHLNLGFADSAPNDAGEATALASQLSHWNLRAGQKALASVAYGPAMTYFRLGLNRLPHVAWQSDYDLTLALHTCMVESAYLYGDVDVMHHYANLTLQKAETHLDRVSTYMTLMQAYKAQTKNQEAVSVGLDALSHFGITFPKPVTQADEANAWEEVHAVLTDRPLADLAALPTVTEPEIVASIDLLSRLVTAAWSCDHSLYVLIAMKRLLLLLEHGNMDASSAVYSAYGLNLCSKGEIDRGYQFGMLAIAMQEKYHAAIFEARTQTMVNIFIRHWKEHLAQTLPGLKKGYESGLEAGDIEFAAACLQGVCIHAFFAGQSLTTLKSEMIHHLNSIERTRQKKHHDRVTICCQVINNLQDDYQNPTLLAGSFFNETTHIHIREKSNDLDTLKLYYV
ncbi:ATP-binding protein, partial [Candidatus Entotheonella palauensis]|uniref:ATP-binding protein n=1 Tax=Candidatus Entotheonella palauensis TaxID=93172 RepID=UPI0015C45F67